MPSPHFRRTTVLGALLALCLAQSLPAATFHVAERGDDTNPGTESQPFATLARAQVAARQAAGREPVNVLLHTGTYRLEHPLSFAAADSGTAATPVVYQAASGEATPCAGGFDWTSVAHTR